MKSKTFWVVIALQVLLAPATANEAAQGMTHRAGGFVVATWNIAWLGDGENDHVLVGHKQHARSAADYARLARYAKALNADVVALQEVENTAAVARVFPPSAWHIFVSSRATAAKWAQRTAIVVRKGIAVKRHADVKLSALPIMRYGVDVEVSLDGHALRILSVHLKSKCWHKALSSSSWACRVLAGQVPYLEAWIDARATEGANFIVAGDWNRHITRAGDAVWSALDDASPSGLRLSRPAGSFDRPRCWNKRYKEFVSHVVLGGEATEWLVPSSFREALYAEEDSAHWGGLSDHCPVSVAIRPR